MLDMHDIIGVLRLITGASDLTTLRPCYTMQMPAPAARDESQQPSRLAGAGFVLSGGYMGARKTFKPAYKTDRVCEACGVTFQDWPHQQRVTCSRACKARRQVVIAERLRRERFYAKVEKTATCWLWKGQVNKKGYGVFGSRGAPTTIASRLAYILEHGPISDRIFVLHRCDNPPCVNPAHLFLGTKQDNANDMVAKRRHLHGERNPHAKLTADLVREIRRRFQEDGMRQVDIASETGIDKRRINSIVHYRTWKYV